MLKGWLASLGLGAALAGAVAAPAVPDPLAGHRPLYETLFGDRPQAFRPAAGAPLVGWQALLFGPDPAVDAVRALAADRTQDSRVRALACGWLRERAEPLPPRELLGVVLEVEVAGGLDVLAAYADGRLRYLNHGGRAVLVDAPTPAQRGPWQALLDAARTASARARPWVRSGSAVPGAGGVRVGFLRTDGLAMREGRFEALQRDPELGPTLYAASLLLRELTQSLR